MTHLPHSFHCFTWLHPCPLPKLLAATRIWLIQLDLWMWTRQPCATLDFQTFLLWVTVAPRPTPKQQLLQVRSIFASYKQAAYDRFSAAQTEVVYENLKAVMRGQNMPLTYDGYASCPLITGYDKCILAEFDYDLNPLETFPFSQDKERLSMFLLKKNIIPTIYWTLMMNGHWNGPALFRKIMHFGKDK